MARMKRAKVYKIRILTDKWSESIETNRDIAINKAQYAVLFDGAKRSQVLLDDRFIATFKAGIDYTVSTRQ